MSHVSAFPHDLYRLYDSSGTLLYIGISYSAISRLSQHRATQPWAAEIARLDRQHLGPMTRREAEDIERQAIIAEKPLHNKTHNGSGRTTATVESQSNGTLVGGFIGAFFVSPDPKDGWPLAQWQGQVVEMLGDGFVLVNTHSWWDGYLWCAQVVRIDQMAEWHFFYDVDDWRRAADKAAAARDRMLDNMERAK